METTVYADLFFMINFSMDFLCLFLTAKILNLRFSPVRGIFASAFGGGYAIFALFFSFGSLFALLLDLASGILLCLIAFYRKGELKRAPVYSLVYGAISMALGGVMTALFTLFNKTGIFEGIKKTDGDGLSVWLFALLAAISGIMTLAGGRFFSGRMSRRRIEMEITYNGKKISISAMTDSGNLLREPVRGKPCIVSDIEAVRAIIPKEVLKIAASGDILGIDRLPSDCARRISVIPSTGVSGDKMLLGFRADKIALADGKRNYEVDAVLALARLGKEADGCMALVPSTLLMG
ncbi:MAG: hypothetical protein E7607_07885 [Ruminococcaceae bacterium]|nr:hypothetical protein [Oscillospiraceae bacterium]